MPMVVKTEIFPLRVSLRKKEPWELIVEITNSDSREKMVSVRIELPAEANFSTIGLNHAFEKNTESFRANATAQLKMPVYLSNYAKVGNHFGKIKVMEHFNDFDHVERTYTKEIPFRIVE